MIYLDNAATSFPKPRSVIKELNRCIKRYCGNPGRSSHVLSLRAAEEIYSARECLASHLGVSCAENIVFTPNATFGLNLALKTMIKPNCHVICSDFEHNSVIRPLNKLNKERNISYDVFRDVNQIPTLIKENTVAIVCSLASNVTGEEIDLGLLSSLSTQNNLKLIVDSSQAVGHREFNIEKTPCDAFCAPGHKALFGIQGSGFVNFANSIREDSFIEGGSGSDSKRDEMPMALPEAYEAGTLSTPAIVSLSKGVEYINEIGIDNIREQLSKYTDELYERLDSIKGITIYGKGCGILSFNYSDIPSTEIASLLNRKGICVRGGLHCAPSVHRRLGTINQGAVRVSFSCMNRRTDVDRMVRAIKEII
jgi:cysteine desulfurase family protein